MATPFRQPILPGDSGKDVRAVKRTLSRMNVPGNGSMGESNFAGDAFVKCIRAVQRHAGKRADGIYGKDTHAIVAPHFRAYEVQLYRSARIRDHKLPGTDTTAAAAAKQLLTYQSKGQYRADNSADLPQIKAAAEGRAVWSPMGKYVHIDKRVFEVINLLIGEGVKVGTFAICSDHHYDGPNGHSGGVAVDISSVSGVGVSSPSARDETLKAAKILHALSGELKPWQLICDGYGYQHDGAIAACTIPSPDFYGYATMSQHRNHIHVGYHP